MSPANKGEPRPLTLDFVVPCGRPDSPAAGNTLACLAAITKGVPSNVIVVGAGVSALRSRYPENFSWVDTDGRLWPADNRNLGARQSRADIIGFLDDDCRLEPDASAKVLRRFAEEPALGVLSGKIVSAISTYVSRCFDLVAFTYQQADTPVWNPPALVSAFMCVRRSLFDTLGGFDREIRLREDVDLVHRVLERGYKSLYAPEIRILHDHGRYSWRKFLLYQFRNGLRPYVMERKALTRQRAGKLRWHYRLKIGLRYIHFILFPGYAALNVWRTMRSNAMGLLRLIEHLPGIVVGLLAYELGRVCAPLALGKRDP